MTELQSCKRAKLLLTEMHTPYIACVCVHTAVVGRTTVTWRCHRGHTHESQAVAQLLHAEVTGVTQREENNRINIHHSYEVKMSTLTVQVREQPSDAKI